MAHNEDTKTFDDIFHHLELQYEQLEGVKISIAQDFKKSFNFKKKMTNGPKWFETHHGKDQDNYKQGERQKTHCKHSGNKNNSKVKCFNYGKLGHYACKYSEPQMYTII